MGKVVFVHWMSFLSLFPPLHVFFISSASNTYRKTLYLLTFSNMVIWESILVYSTLPYTQNKPVKHFRAVQMRKLNLQTVKTLANTTLGGQTKFWVSGCFWHEYIHVKNPQCLGFMEMAKCYPGPCENVERMYRKNQPDSSSQMFTV